MDVKERRGAHRLRVDPLTISISMTTSLEYLSWTGVRPTSPSLPVYRHVPINRHRRFVIVITSLESRIGVRESIQFHNGL